MLHIKLSLRSVSVLIICRIFPYGLLFHDSAVAERTTTFALCSRIKSNAVGLTYELWKIFHNSVFTSSPFVSISKVRNRTSRATIRPFAWSLLTEDCRLLLTPCHIEFSREFFSLAPDADGLNLYLVPCTTCKGACAGHSPRATGSLHDFQGEENRPTKSLEKQRRGSLLGHEGPQAAIGRPLIRSIRDECPGEQFRADVLLKG